MIISNLGEKINSFIKQKGVTQEKLAKRIGISKRNLNYIIESNEIKKLETFVKLCYTLSVSPNELLEEVGNLPFTKNIIVPFPELIPTRTILEIEYMNLDDQINIERYSVIFTRENDYISITFDKQLFVKHYISCKLPFLLSNDVRYYKIEHSIHSKRIELLVNSPANYLAGFRINNPERIKEERLYATVNGHSGKDFSFLKYNSLEDEISFIGIGDQPGQDIDPKGELYVLKAKDVYEIWEINTLMSITNELDDYFSHFLHDKQSLETLYSK